MTEAPTSVNWPFIAVKFCALVKNPEFGGGSIAMLTDSINMCMEMSVLYPSCPSQGSLPNSVQQLRRSQEERENVTSVTFVS
jgi:hypothetical protein